MKSVCKWNGDGFGEARGGQRPWAAAPAVLPGVVQPWPTAPRSARIPHFSNPETGLSLTVSECLWALSREWSMGWSVGDILTIFSWIPPLGWVEASNKRCYFGSVSTSKSPWVLWSCCQRMQSLLKCTTSNFIAHEKEISLSSSVIQGKPSLPSSGQSCGRRQRCPWCPGCAAGSAVCLEHPH